MNVLTGIITVILVSSCHGKYNRQVILPKSTYCSTGSLSFSTRQLEIDGAELKSGYSSIYKRCAIRFKGDASNSDMVVKVKTWNSISGSMEIYSGSNLVSTVTSSTISGHEIRVTGRYVTFKYYTSSWSSRTSSGDFHFIITAVEKTSTGRCSEFKCFNGRCIDKDLKCDRVDHCGDYSDELCDSKNKNVDLSNNIATYIRLGVGVISGIIVGVIVLCIVIVVVCVVCCQRSRAQRGTVIRSPGQQGVTVTATTHAPPGSYPAQPTSYPMNQAGYPAAQPTYPAPQPGYPAPQPAYHAPPPSTPLPYGQGSGYTALDHTANAPPTYEKATAPSD